MSATATATRTPTTIPPRISFFLISRKLDGAGGRPGDSACPLSTSVDIKRPLARSAPAERVEPQDSLVIPQPA